MVKSYAKLENKNTNPGYVITQKRPSIETYEQSVKRIVQLEEIKQLLKINKASYKGYKNSRGLIGATALIAWLPTRDKTYELITYRDEKKWGTKRIIDDKSVKMIDKLFPSTFDNYDYKNKHNRIVPNSPCPVLFGIRGTDEKDLVNAKKMIKSEKIKLLSTTVSKTRFFSGIIYIVLKK